jgi:hypothetical protein
MTLSWNKLTDDEEIRYVIEPHNVRPEQKVVTVYCGNELICSFYMHSYKDKRYAVLMSKHIKDVYTDTRNPLAPGVIIDLGSKV